MAEYVYVVTGKDLGWNCVVGVWSESSENLERLKEEYPRTEYVIHKVLLEKYVQNI